MQPPSMMFGHCFRADAPTSYPSLSGFNQNSFNFKDLSMKKSGSDYFNMNPLHTSSPAASLAADLSQNFHIDQRFVFIVCWCGVVLCSAGQNKRMYGSLLTLCIARSWLRPDGLCSRPTSWAKRIPMVSNPCKQRCYFFETSSTNTMNRRRDDHPSPPCLLARSRHGRHGNVAAAAQEACLCSDY